jgi:hypothetical protein
MMLSPSRLIWSSGLAAALGGMMWMVKAGSIILSGVQPPVVFELALFPLPAAATAAIHFEMPILLVDLSWLLLGGYMWYTMGHKAASRPNSLQIFRTILGSNRCARFLK